MALSWRPRIVCMTGEGLTLFELGSDSDFSNIYTMYNTGERNEPEIIIFKFKKQPLDPLSYPIKYPN